MKQLSKRKHTRKHDDTIIEKLKSDKAFAKEYLKAALENLVDDTGLAVLTKVLKNMAEAKGIAKVAKVSGVPRESVYRALSDKGNPRLDTFLNILKGTGLQLKLEPRKVA